MRFSLDQFDKALKTRDSKGRPYILIGGQAVNFWATRYVRNEPELTRWMPFTSEDIDFKGTRADAIRIASQLGLKERLPGMAEITALSGIIPITISGSPASIEVVRTIPGVTSKDVEQLAIQQEWHGEQIRILDPISLLRCKVDLAITVSQKTRRDVDHLRIMIVCVRAFLREALHGVERGDLPVKGWLGALERTLRLSSSTLGLRAARRFSVNWLDVLPHVEIENARIPQLMRLREKRLPRWHTKVERFRTTA